MYQGKFDAKSKGQKAPKQTIEELLAQRTAANEAAKQPKVKKTQSANKQVPKPQPVVQPLRPDERTAAPQNRPAPSQQKSAQMAQQRIAQSQKPVVPQTMQAPQSGAKAQKRGPRLGSVIFYTLYFLFIFVFFAGMFFVLQWLRGWLMDYEAAQPTVKCQEVFDELFSHPDWRQLYLDAGVEDTEYEGVDQYVAYMEEKVGDKKLDFVETSAGLSGDKKYIVRLEGEKVATFTLEGQAESITDIPDWELGKVEVFFQRQQGCLIQKLDGHKAFVNGQELDDSFTIQIATTKVEKFLPVGTVGVRVCTQKIDNLLAMPEVKITNQQGQEMEVVYDEASNTYAEQVVSTVIPDDAKEATLGALKAYAEFMINAAGSRTAVNKYYDGGSQVYSDIVKMAGELWMNHDYGHSFKDESVTAYCRYGDDLFSVRGSITMHVTCKDGSEKDYPVDQSLFFRKKDGNWVCYEMTNEDVSQPVGQVRLTFINDGVELSSEFYDTAVKEIQTPVVSVPEGKVFSGWVRQGTDESGHSTWVVVFTPDETGLVSLGNSASLEPMTLYALFENAPAEGGETE